MQYASFWITLGSKKKSNAQLSTHKIISKNHFLNVVYVDIILLESQHTIKDYKDFFNLSLSLSSFIILFLAWRISFFVVAHIAPTTKQIRMHSEETMFSFEMRQNCQHFRLFEDDNGLMRLSVLDSVSYIFNMKFNASHFLPFSFSFARKSSLKQILFPSINHKRHPFSNSYEYILQ